MYIDRGFRWGYPETDKRLKKIIKQQAKEIRELKKEIKKLMGQVVWASDYIGFEIDTMVDWNKQFPGR